MKGKIMSIEELAAMIGGSQDKEAPKPLPEAAVATLREAFDRYAAGCPFKPGDLVTPRKGFNHGGAGDPSIVLEVPDEAVRPFDASDPRSTANHTFGARLDMRVATIQDGDVVAYWDESWAFEPYSPC